MAGEVVVPEVGEVGMEITLVSWLKSEGDHVAEGDALFELDTAKATLEVQAFQSGVLHDVRVHEGDSVQPRQVLALLLEPGERVDDRTDEAGDAEESPGGPTARVTGLPVSPRARRLARDLGVDVARVAGTGPGGLVTTKDVERAGDESGHALSAGPMDDRDRTRQAVAVITQRNWQSIPHIQLSVDIDVTAVLAEVRPTVAVLAGLTRALHLQPECNLEWRSGTLVRRSRVDLGLLVDTPRGLLLPAIRGADGLSLGDLDVAVQEAVERARSGVLSSADQAGRSGSVSNLGMFAVDAFDGVIASPDVLLLTVGRARTLPRWRAGTLAVRKIITCTLALDHRALDGADGGRLLDRLETALSDPEVLRGDLRDQ